MANIWQQNVLSVIILVVNRSDSCFSVVADFVNRSYEYRLSFTLISEIGIINIKKSSQTLNLFLLNYKGAKGNAGTSGLPGRTVPLIKN